MKFFVFIFVITCIFIGFNQPIHSQTTERKKPKVKNFGSSLNRKAEENLNPKKQKTENRDEDIIRIDTNLVVTECLVIDKKGNIIDGLKMDDFIITEDNQPQEIQTFTLGNDAKLPRSIVLIIDYSGSQLPFIENSIEAAKLLVDKLNPNDLMAIVTDDVELITQFTSDRIKLKKDLDSLKKDALSKRFGRSMQFSSLYAVLNEMFDDEDVRPIILFQTDGDQIFNLRGGIEHLALQQMISKDTMFRPLQIGNFSFNELIQKLEKSRATIYTIFPGFRRIGLSDEEKKERIKAEQEARNKAFEKLYGKRLQTTPPQPTGRFAEYQKIREELIKKYYPNGLPDVQDAMFNLSSLSGGWMDFLEKPEDADGIYSRIFSEINTRYIIGFAPNNETKDGKKRTVNIEIKNHPEYIVWGRKTYFAPLPD